MVINEKEGGARSVIFSRARVGALAYGTTHICDVLNEACGVRSKRLEHFEDEP